MIGPGLYDDVATAARKATGAEALLLIVIDGTHGSGFSAQLSRPIDLFHLPEILRELARQIEADQPAGFAQPRRGES